MGLAVGLVIFVRTIVKENTRDYFYVTATARYFVKDDPAVQEKAKEVMSVYGSMTEKERAETGTEAYRRHFAKITEGEGYQRIYDMLMQFRLHNAIDNVYFVVYDKENSSLVHLIDTDTHDELGFKTGDWEYINRDDVEQFLNLEDIPFYVHRSADNHQLYTTGISLSVIDDETKGMILTDFIRDDLAYDISMFMTRFILEIVAASIIFGLILSRQVSNDKRWC